MEEFEGWWWVKNKISPGVRLKEGTQVTTLSQIGRVTSSSFLKDKIGFSHTKPTA
jgi:hypothetical protein